jgi:quinol monooxygenase YgiN
MITRVVKLSFKPENIQAFQAIFAETKQQIEQFKGCIGVKGFQDSKQPELFFTISQWESEMDLNAYRNSAFFESVWSRTKALFNDKPAAWTISEL